MIQKNFSGKCRKKRYFPTAANHQKQLSISDTTPLSSNPSISTAPSSPSPTLRLSFPPTELGSQFSHELDALYSFLKSSTMGKMSYILENIKEGRFNFDDSTVINTYRFYCPCLFESLYQLVNTGNNRQGINKQENVALTIESLLVQRKNFSISPPFLIKNGLLCKFGSLTSPIQTAFNHYAISCYVDHCSN